MTEHPLTEWIFAISAEKTFSLLAEAEGPATAKVIYRSPSARHGGCIETDLFSSRASAARFEDSLQAACRLRGIQVTLQWYLPGSRAWVHDLRQDLPAGRTWSAVKCWFS